MRSPILASLFLFAACGSTDPASDSVDAGSADAVPATPDAGPTAPDYGRLFPSDRVLDVDLAITPDDWATLMADPLVDVYVPATLTYDGETVTQVGVRIKGNSSRWSVANMGSERFSFKVDIDYYVDGQKLFGVDKLNLNNGFKDPSFLRERLALDLLREYGLPAPQTTYARLTISSQLHGLYTVVEQVDKDFLADRFPDDSGNLYKPEQPDGELTWRGDSIGAYPKLELKTNEDAPDHTAILHFLDVLNHTPTDQLETALAEVLDVELFLRWLAVNTVLVNMDSYAGTAHNYYLYEDRTTGRFVYVPWDVNEAYGNFDCNLAPDVLIGMSYLQPICQDPARRPLIMKVLAVPAFRATYEAHLRAVLEGPFAAAAVAARVDALAALIRPYVIEDPTRFSSVADFEANLYDDVPRGPRVTFGLTSFAERRGAALATQLP